MQKKSRNSKAFTFISLSIGIILALVFIAPNNFDENLNVIGVIIVAPFLLLAAIVSSIIAVFLNKRSIGSWIVLGGIVVLFSIAIYLLLGFENLPFGAGTR
jgi:drug/metabolite transporter (DMT)-like permease